VILQSDVIAVRPNANPFGITPFAGKREFGRKGIRNDEFR